MHPSKVVLKVIKAGPDLARVLAKIRGALIAFSAATSMMDTLFVPFQVVRSSEAVPSFLTIENVTSIRLLVFGHVFPDVVE